MFRPVYTLHRRLWMPNRLHETFEFFERPQNLALITPPWLGFRILTPEPIVMARGLTIDYSLRVLGVPSHWRSLISGYDPPNSFRDEQVLGPYRRWDHRHRFWRENGGTGIEDFVVYELPLGPLGVLLNRLAARRHLDAIFDYRQVQVTSLLTPIGESGAPPFTAKPIMTAPPQSANARPARAPTQRGVSSDSSAPGTMWYLSSGPDVSRPSRGSAP